MTDQADGAEKPRAAFRSMDEGSAQDWPARSIRSSVQRRSIRTFSPGRTYLLSLMGEEGARLA